MQKNATNSTYGRNIHRREVLSTGLKVMSIAVGGATFLDACQGVIPPVKASAHTILAADQVVIKWNDAILQMIRVTRPGPPIAARALAILHTCIYDAWAAYDPLALGTRLRAALRRPLVEHTLANKHKAISYAAYRALADLYPTAIPQFDAIMHELGYNPTDTSTNINTPVGIGNVAAQAVLDFRHSDGSNQLGNLHATPYSDYRNYIPLNTPNIIKDPDHWQPLRVSDGHNGMLVQKYATACCGLIAPFALNSGAQFRPTLAPATYHSDEYMAQAQQILAYSANLTDEHKAIVEYWMDGPSSEQPPGHWNLFAQFVAKRDSYNLDKSVQLFFILNNALFDAGIAAWDCKLHYNSVRPLTAVHYLFNNKHVTAWAGPYQGSKNITGKNWLPYQKATIVTPPFPEYVSGHSTFSASGAEVLTRFTGNDSFGLSYTAKAKRSLIEPGLTPTTDITLSYPTFSAAANEAGISRRYGGIHFEKGDLQGRELGRLVGQQVWQKAQAYING